MSGTIRLGTIAHGRSGDKGPHANVAVIAYTDAGFAWLRDHLTTERVAAYFADLELTRIERFEAPNVHALNFLLYDALGGGASRSLWTDTQGKTLALSLLEMPIDRPEDLDAMTRSQNETEHVENSVLHYEVQAPAAILTINRPHRRGALNRELITVLGTAFRRAEDDPTIRCIILTGSGNAFCAGMDLDELRSTLNVSDEEELIWNDAQTLARLYEQIAVCPKPTIAAVNGAAVAGGAGLVSVCDLAVAVEGAKFGYPEVRRGLVAAMVMPHLLRHVGERAARWMLLSGELIDAREAHRVGFINEVVEPNFLMDRATEWAHSLAEGGPVALAETKSLLRQFTTHGMSIEDAARASAAPRLGEEGRQGIEAFFEKRLNPWSPGAQM